jgi:hypothetical protein
LVLHCFRHFASAIFEHAMRTTFRSVEIFTPVHYQHKCGLTCEDLLNILRRLSLLGGLVRPKSGQPGAGLTVSWELGCHASMATRRLVEVGSRPVST